MNDKACAVKAAPAESFRDIIADQAKLIESINDALDGFTGNTFPSAENDAAPRMSVTCFMDALVDNRLELLKVRDNGSLYAADSPGKL